MTAYLRSFANRESAGQFARVTIIGVFNSIVDFGLFNLLHYGIDIPLLVAGALAFLAGAFGSYFLNRYWTFGLRDGWGSAVETGAFVVINVVALGVTEAFLAAADAWWGPLEPLAANVTKVAAALVILVPKFAGYRDLVFHRSLEKARRS